MSSWKVGGLELLWVKVFGLAISSQHSVTTNLATSTFYWLSADCFQLILSSIPAVTNFFSMCRWRACSRNFRRSAA